MIPKDARPDTEATLREALARYPELAERIARQLLIVLHSEGLISIDEPISCRDDKSEFVWIGIADPTQEEMRSLANCYDLHPLAIEDAINLRGFDEVIISTLPTKVSRWLKLDLPSKVTGMGLPVTTVTPED